MSVSGGCVVGDVRGGCWGLRCWWTGLRAMDWVHEAGLAWRLVVTRRCAFLFAYVGFSMVCLCQDVRLFEMPGAC